jgi:cytochrome P450
LDILYEAAPGVGDKKLENAATAALFVYRIGAETTIGLLGLLIRTLVDHPELRKAATNRPETIDAIISEVLRLESNVQRVLRLATESRHIGGHLIEKGQRVMLVLGAANRDPLAFPDPNKISLEEKRRPDVAFGAGGHFCLGANLARLEARIALTVFCDLPMMERAGPEKWYSGRIVRRLTELPLKMVTPA